MKVAIIGAGIAGLAAGHEFTKLGHDVEIYEATDRAGGRARLLKRPGTDDWTDVGSQYFHSNYKNGLRLIDELGLTPKLKAIKGKTRMFTKPSSSYLLNPSLPWMKPGGIIGNIKMGLYLARLLLSNRSDTFAASPEQQNLDKVAGLDSTDNGFIKDHIVRMLTLVGGLSEPSFANVNMLQIYRLAKIILLTDYVSLEGGTATLHKTLAERATIHYNSPVKELIETDGAVSGFTLENGEVVSADHVVVAAHAPRAAEIVPSNWTQESDYLSGIEMPPAILVSLFLDRPLEQDVWGYFMPLDHDGPVGMCVDTHQKSPSNTPSGKATLQILINNPESAKLIDQSDEEISAIVRRDIAPFLPHVDNAIEGFEVTRHHNAVPQASVGHNAQTLEFLENIDRRKGVSFCGDYMSGGYMESALWSVERAVLNLTGTKA